MNPFNWTGPEFLQLYLVVLFLVVIGAFVVRWRMRQPSDEPPAETHYLSPYEIAYLSGGERLAIDAAIVGLIQREILDIDAGSGRLSRSIDELPTTVHRLEKIVFHACKKESGALLHEVRQKASATAKDLRKRPVELGLLLQERQASFVQIVPVFVVLGATLFGLIKVFVGVARNRPVGYLVFLVVLSVAVAIFFFVKRPFRSRRGDRAMQQLKHDNAALEYHVSRPGNELAYADLLLAVGLFGIGALAGGPLGRLPAARKAPSPLSTSSGGWVSSCGGGGCGGGCGGGGCGGCGG